MIPNNPEEPLQFVPIGEIVGVFGVVGRLKVQPLTDFAERFEVGATVYIRRESYKVTWQAFHKTQVRIGLRGIDTIDQVENLIGERIFARADDRPTLDKDEFYAGDLFGMEVVLVDGTLIGTVSGVLTSGPQDILQVGKSLIPMLKQFVQSVDIKKREIVVTPIEGMIEEDTE